MADESTAEIDRHQFYFETPLYEFINVGSLSEDILKGDVDAYNTQSHYDTTFEIDANRIGDKYSDYFNFYTITLTCKRNDKDILRFFVYVGDKTVVKMGQFPSVADIQFEEINTKYSLILSPNDLNEFKKAVKLVSDGIGVGSFVYLRRIFESLVLQTFDLNRKGLDETKDEFQKLKMEDKVIFLKEFLPSQLVEMKSIYKILSKGIHELTEQECLAYFSPLKLSIELILDQKIEMDLKKQKDEAVKQQIANITEVVTAKKDTL